MGKCKSFKQRLSDDEAILVAEGYIFEFERRGYLSAGAFVPEVVLEKPELVRELHEYYGHREKLRIIGREQDLEPMQRKALEIARAVADESDTLMAGNICNTTVFDFQNPKSHEEAAKMFQEQIEWAEQGGADLIIAETFPDYGEAKLSLECIRKFSSLPAIINIAPHARFTTRDGYTFADALKLLEEQGADVVGLNCSSGPQTIIDMMKDVRAKCTGPLAALPVTYRTTDQFPQMQNLILPMTGEMAFFSNLDYFTCAADEFYKFGLDCQELGIQVPGICCGNTVRYMRRLAESYGRKPPASKYSPDMSKHYIFGSNPMLRSININTLRGKIAEAGSEKDLPPAETAGV